MSDRNLVTVIDQLLEVAPEFKEQGLLSIRDSAMYSAPENVYIFWQELALFLNREATDHPEKEKLAKIFSGV